MARHKLGKTFTTRSGRRGAYKYVNGKRVGFVATKKKYRSKNKSYRRRY